MSSAVVRYFCLYLDKANYMMSEPALFGSLSSHSEVPTGTGVYKEGENKNKGQDTVHQERSASTPQDMM